MKKIMFFVMIFASLLLANCGRNDNQSNVPSSEGKTYGEIFVPWRPELAEPSMGADPQTTLGEMWINTGDSLSDVYRSWYRYTHPSKPKTDFTDPLCGSHPGCG